MNKKSGTNCKSAPFFFTYYTICHVPCHYNYVKVMQFHYFKRGSLHTVYERGFTFVNIMVPILAFYLPKHASYPTNENAPAFVHLAHYTFQSFHPKIHDVPSLDVMTSYCDVM